MPGDADQTELLRELLATQDSIRRLEDVDFVEELNAHEAQGYHRALKSAENQESRSDAYRSSSPSSVPAGTPLIISPTENPADVPWADYHRAAQSAEYKEFPCANGTDCVGAESSCLSWFDCGPNEWCEDFQCVPKDPNRPCRETWECPSPPTEEQWYECVEDKCRLTCGNDQDCPTGEICDPSTFLCDDGCRADNECDPSDPDAAPDARPGSYCVNYACVTPCDPPTLCGGTGDVTTCGDGLVCRDKLMRGPRDPDGPLYECVKGCNFDADCPDFETDLNGLVAKFPQVCINDRCLRVCSGNGDCLESIGEACVEGICENIGTICNGDDDCQDSEFCNEDGRCKSGCRDASSCLQDCDKDRACVDACGPDPSCVCTDVYSGEDCGTSYTEDWRDFCPQDPACIEACPDDPNCAASNARPLACVDNTCKLICDTAEDCAFGDGAQNYICRKDEVNPMVVGGNVVGECQWSGSSSVDGEEICEITETCEEDEAGNINCVQEEKCSFVSPYVGPDFYGCDCAEVCDQDGQCVPGVCARDADCESCSYCRSGVCTPGCDEDNPCAEDECCINGKCKPSCSQNADCLPGESCSDGGCCAPICIGYRACIGGDDCYDGEKCFEGFCESGCDDDNPCGDGSVCDEGVCWFGGCNTDDDCSIDSFEECYSSPNGKYCRQVKELCSTDNDCPPKQTSDGGLTQICFDGECKVGCRADDDCPTSMLCLEGVNGRGNCEYICNDDEQCASLGFGDKCASDQKAKARAKAYNDIIQRTGTSLEKRRWSDLAISPDTGVCITDMSGREDEGEPYCRGYQDCVDGTCIRLPCQNATDCPDGSCLSDGQCGVCRGDNDCPGSGVCDSGSCETACFPDIPCTIDEDCPTGNFCLTERNQVGQTIQYCAEGCRSISLCSVPEDCPRPTPSGNACFEQSCRFDFDCQQIEASGGLCKNDSDCPTNEECELGSGYGDADEGYCVTTIKAECQDGLCINSNLGCPFGEVCFFHGDPSIIEYDGTCQYPLIDCQDGVCQTDSGTCYPGERCRSGECMRKCDPDSSEGPCSEGERCVSGLCEYVGFSCITDSDCPPEEGECFQGTCRQDLRCNVHADCPSERMACIDKLCQDAERCDSNADCARTCEGSEDCRSRQSSGSPCETTENCEGREYCSDGKCTYPPASCNGGICVGEDPDDQRFCGPEGICLTGEACSFDSDCSFPDICAGSVCQFVTRCSSDSQCGDGLYCKSNLCVTDNRCNIDSDCFGGFYCDASNFCREIDGLSRDGRGSGCDSCNETCGEDFRCRKVRCQSNRECPCGGFCDRQTGTCTDRCLDDTFCPGGYFCDLDQGQCVQKQPCLSEIDCPGQVDCNDEGFCDTPFSSCLVDSDCEPGVCIDGECMDCRDDRQCKELGKGVGCDEDGQNCLGDQLICFNNTCETPCYTGITEGSCADGLQYGDLCEFCADECPGGSSECVEDGSLCGEVLEWDPELRRTVYVPIPCKRCTLACDNDRSCLQSCQTAADCEQYEATGAPCDPDPGLPCDRLADDTDVCPIPEESLLECEINGVLDSSFCANSYETCRVDPESPGEPAKCRFDDIQGGSPNTHACAQFDADNSNFVCSTNQQCPDNEECREGRCQIPLCAAGETCNLGTCDFDWRIPTCKPNGRCLGTEADRAYDPCPFGEVCGEKFVCEWPEPTCVGGRYCEGVGLIQNSVCEYDEVAREKRCEYWEGRCDSSADCTRMSAVDGQPRYCKEYQCVAGEFCIGNSDCDPGQLCEDMQDADGNSLGIGSVCTLGPGWNEGVADCLTNDECGTGKVCADRVCVFECGPSVEAFPCRGPSDNDPGIACPPDFRCNTMTSLCERPGYDGIDRYMTECAKGETCWPKHNGCVPLKGGSSEPPSEGGEPSEPEQDYDCRSPLDCNGELCNAQQRTKWDCIKGECTEVWRDEYPARAGEKMCTDPDRVDDDEQQDICEKQGKCCSDIGFCESCQCDDANPCEDSDECCDRESGLCINRRLHPQTEFGAPAQCSFDQVFCEVLGPDGDDGDRSTVDVTAYEGKGYKGCQTEILADGSEKTTCWEGGPLSASAISQLLLQECSPFEEKDDCTCDDEPPDTNECFSDLDCGSGQTCEAKTWFSTICCPVSDEFGNDNVTRLICSGKSDPSEGCLSDEDCGDCETCEGVFANGTNIRLGTCAAACDSLCPCGGPLSEGVTYKGRDTCPTCEERFGKGCITEVNSESSKESVDPDTGALIPAGTSCDCAVKQDNPCCEKFYDRGASGECGPEPSLDCRFGQLRGSRDGCVYREYKAPDGGILVGQVDYCVDFEEGLCARCTRDAHCPGNSVCLDHQCTTECGGEGEIAVTGNCWCCTPDLECRELYEGWTESRDSSRGVETRACACTKDGIDCQPWKTQESCYAWVLEDAGDGEQAKAERERKQDSLEQKKLDLIGVEADLAAGFEERNRANAEVNAAQGEVDKFCGTPDEACCNAEQQFVDKSRREAEIKDELEEANEILTDLETDLEEAQEKVSAAEAEVNRCCGEFSEDCSCEAATGALGEATEEFNEINDEKIPEQRLQIETIEEALKSIAEEIDYWANQIKDSCPEYYEPCDPLDTSCVVCSGEPNADCLKAQGQLDSANNALAIAQQKLDKAIVSIQDLEYQIRVLEAQIEETVYRPAKWSQRRTCNCCIDGECRDETECTYGTCYLCRQDDVGDAKKYRAQLYNKVGGAVSIVFPSVETCAGCVSINDSSSLDGHKDCPRQGFINDIGGQTAMYFEDATECVKYRCEDGITLTEEFCTGDINSWYDYCIGSVFGCILRANTAENIYWWNGYDTTMYCPLAGFWFYNRNSDPPEYNQTFNTNVPKAGGNWINVIKPQDSIARTSCAYPNPLGHIQSNYLTVFEGMGGVHACCNPSDIIHECNPDYPNCYPKFELLFEPGAPSLLIARLEAEIEALERYVVRLNEVNGELEALKNEQETIKQGYEAELDSLDSGIEDLEEAIVETEGQIGEQEAVVQQQEAITEQAIQDYEDSATGLDEISEEKNAAIAERDTLKEAYDQTEKQLEEVTDNHSNAKKARDDAEREKTRAEGYLETLQKQALDQECVCSWSGEGLSISPGDCPTDAEGNTIPPAREDTVDCFEIMQMINEQLLVLQEASDLYEQLNEAVNDLQKEIDDLKLELSNQAGPLEEAEREVTRLTTKWDEAAKESADERANRDKAVQDLKNERDKLVNLNLQLDALIKQLEAAEGTESQKQDLEDAIAKVDVILGNIQASFDIVSDEISESETAIDDKTAEAERLEEDWEEQKVPKGTKRPDADKGVLDGEELKELYDKTVSETEKALNEEWYPNGQG